jgi:hypothetical protein
MSEHVAKKLALAAEKKHLRESGLQIEPRNGVDNPWKVAVRLHSGLIVTAHDGVVGQNPCAKRFGGSNSIEDPMFVPMALAILCVAEPCSVGGFLSGIAPRAETFKK